MYSLSSDPTRCSLGFFSGAHGLHRSWWGKDPGGLRLRGFLRLVVPYAGVVLGPLVGPDVELPCGVHVLIMSRRSQA